MGILVGLQRGVRGWRGLGLDWGGMYDRKRKSGRPWWTRGRRIVERRCCPQNGVVALSAILNNKGSVLSWCQSQLVHWTPRRLGLFVSCHYDFCCDKLEVFSMKRCFGCLPYLPCMHLTRYCNLSVQLTSTTIPIYYYLFYFHYSLSLSIRPLIASCWV